MWGTGAGAHPERPDVTLSVRVSRAEIDAIRAAARRAGEKPTAFVRAAATSRATRWIADDCPRDPDRLGEAWGTLGTHCADAARGHHAEPVRQPEEQDAASVRD